ncbi:MAG: UvrD-helicase domain-containing protein [bacterium]
MELFAPETNACLDAALRDLNPRQKEAVEHGEGPLLIVAGAGTGKTKTLISRITRLIACCVPASRILAVTFTNKAAGEMRKRVDAVVPGHGYKVWMHTFHAFGARMLRLHGSLIGIKHDFVVYDQDEQKKLVKMAIKELGGESEQNKAGLYVSIISRAKDDLLDAQSYAIHAETSGDASRINASRIYSRYQHKLNEAGALDFGDLLLRTVELLRDRDDIREHYQEYFLHVMVDEYQDTNHAQYMLTKTLAAKHRNLCVVGDPDQSIYGWRGADIRNIMEFEKDFNDVKTVVLEQNYRSTAIILNAANNVIKQNRNRKPKDLWTKQNQGESIVVKENASEYDEAAWTARAVQEMLDEGHSLSDMAVFYRTNEQSRSFEDSFRRHQIPYRLIGTVRFYDRKEIKDAVAYARLLVNPSDTVSIMRVLNVPARGIGKAGQEKMTRYAAEKGISMQDVLGMEQAADSAGGQRHAGQYVPGLTSACRRGVREFSLLLENLRRQMLQDPPSRIIEKVLMQTGYWRSIEEEVEKDPEAPARLGNLQELVNAVKEFEERCEKAGTVPSLSAYLEEVSLASHTDGLDAEGSAVTLMTVHLAKGLEFPVVFLTGLEEGLFPIGACNASEDEMEEERRLCYVGMTRARERLFLSYAATRRIFGKAYTNLASRFILESRTVPETAAKPGEEDFHIIAEPYQLSASRQGRILKGQKVRHPVFGTGKIISQSGSGEAAKVTIFFDRGGIQTFMLRYAPLELL